MVWALALTKLQKLPTTTLRQQALTFHIVSQDETRTWATCDICKDYIRTTLHMMTLENVLECVSCLPNAPVTLLHASRCAWGGPSAAQKWLKWLKSIHRYRLEKLRSWQSRLSLSRLGESFQLVDPVVLVANGTVVLNRSLLAIGQAWHLFGAMQILWNRFCKTNWERLLSILYVFVFCLLGLTLETSASKGCREDTASIARAPIGKPSLNCWGTGEWLGKTGRDCRLHLSCWTRPSRSGCFFHWDHSQLFEHDASHEIARFTILNDLTFKSHL